MYVLSASYRRVSSMPVRTASWKLPSEPLCRRHISIPHRPSRRAGRTRSQSRRFSPEAKSSSLFVDLRRKRKRRFQPSWGSLHTRTWGIKRRRAGGLSLSPLQGLSLGQHQTTESCPASTQGHWRSHLTSLKVPSGAWMWMVSAPFLWLSLWLFLPGTVHRLPSLVSSLLLKVPSGFLPPCQQTCEWLTSSLQSPLGPWARVLPRSKVLSGVTQVQCAGWGQSLLLWKTPEPDVCMWSIV